MEMLPVLTITQSPRAQQQAPPKFVLAKMVLTDKLGLTDNLHNQTVSYSCVLPVVQLPDGDSKRECCTLSSVPLSP